MTGRYGARDTAAAIIEMAPPKAGPDRAVACRFTDDPKLSHDATIGEKVWRRVLANGRARGRAAPRVFRAAPVERPTSESPEPFGPTHAGQAVID
jgi:hypothetical protein